MNEELTPQLYRRMKREIKRLTYEIRIASGQVPVLRAMVDGNPDALALLDASGNIIEYNSRLVQLYGNVRMHGIPVRTLFLQKASSHHSEASERWSLLPPAVLKQALEKPTRLHGYCHDIPVEVALSPVMNQEQACIAMAVRVLDDVSAQARELHQVQVRVHELNMELRKQREYQRTTRLESLALLSGTLAHDLNNALAVVTGNLEILKQDLDHEDQLELVEDIALGCVAVRELANRLRMFSRGPSILIAPLDLAAWLSTFLGPLTKSLNVEFKLSFPQEPCWIAADEGRLGQLMLNLLTNARQAASDAQITVQISLRRSEHGQLDGIVEENARALNTPHYLLQVHDSGPGIPEDVLPTIFEPFFTTKRKGSGLGLASVAGIVRAHQGGVSVANHPAGGAVFSMVFPICSPRKLLTRSETLQSKQPLKDRCVLLLEDQDHVRQVMKRHLVYAGATVHAVATGEEALLQYASIRSSGEVPVCVFDLLIEDGMGGIETLEALRLDWPDIIAVACSGHAEVDMAKSYHSFGFQNYIAKPFTRAGLIQTVSDLFPTDAAVTA